MITFKKVSLKLNSELILKDLSFSIKPGEKVAVLGESGAGKSSVFRLLTREIRPTTGEILVGNYNLNHLSLSSLQAYRRQLGIIFQDFQLLPNKTALENVQYALETSGQFSAENTARQLLEYVGLKDRGDYFPTQLSGGQQQRVAIARALVHEPLVVVADEPTGNLDPKSSWSIGAQLLEIHRARKTTLLVATHDPALVRQLRPRVIRLQAGAIWFDEPYSSVERAFQGLVD